MIERVHHIDFVVRDLDRAAEAYARLLGIEPEPRESLESRGVDVVRFRVGDLWLILVQPVTDQSPVARFLDEHGEGFFHIAYRVADLDAEAERLREQGVVATGGGVRRGLEGWKLLDLEATETAGILSQLVQEP